MPTLATIAAELDALAQQLRTQGFNGALGEVNWTYDAKAARVPATTPAGAIVMGFNAGAGGSGSEARWRNKCEKLTAGIANGYVLAELVLISSLNIAELRREHAVDALIEQCAKVNQAVLDYHRPRIVFQTGFDHAEAVEKAYGLTYKGRAPRPAHSTHTLLKHYVMPNGAPWLMIRHLSSPGFSNADLDAIRRYAEETCQIPLAG